MFKKCFSTVACIDATFEELLAYADRHGMQGVEIRMGENCSVCGATDEAALKNGRALFENAGVKIVDLGSSVCLLGYDKNVLTLAYQSIDTAAFMGARAIRVFLGNFAVRHDMPRKPIDRSGIVRALGEMCDYAKKRDIEIWIETHNEFATGKVLAPLMKDVNRENLKIIWDVLHPIEDGEPIAETWRLLAGSIAHVHIKDGFKRADPIWHDYQYTRLGDGEVPLGELLVLLERVGYHEYVSLEWETAWREELQAYAMTTDEVLDSFSTLIEQK